MRCDRYFELLSARLDRELTKEEAEEMELHRTGCSVCRMAGAQLDELREAFDGLEDEPAPEGFAQGVMERIQAEEAKKVIPLFKRPQFRALAGLAACAVLAVGLYGAVHAPPKMEDHNLMVRSFNRDASAEDESAACEVLPATADPAPAPDLDAADVPMIAAYADPGAPVEEEYGTREALTGPNVVYDGAAALQAPISVVKVLTVERMPEGGWELISPETPVSPEGLHVTKELLEQVDQLAAEQGITTSVTSNPEEAEEFVLVVLEVE